MDRTAERRLWDRIGRPSVSAIEPRGSLEIFVPSGTLCVTRGSGVLSLSMARKWIVALEPLFAKGARMSCFHDWAEVVDYEAEARHAIGRWTVRRARACEEIQMLTTSNLLPLAVAALNVATNVAGLEIQATSDRETFYERLGERVAARVPR